MDSIPANTTTTTELSAAAKTEATEKAPAVETSNKEEVSSTAAAAPKDTKTEAEEDSKPAAKTPEELASAAVSSTQQQPVKEEGTADVTTTEPATAPTEEPAAKRQKTSSDNNDNDDDNKVTAKKEEEEEEDEVLDICAQLGFKPGDRLEVEWQLEEESGKTVNKWWGCTLREAESGRVQEGVQIRSVEYDPYPEGGFPERSVEEVIFLSHELMISPDENAEFRYRAEGQVEFKTEEDARAAINAILMETLNKHADKWQMLDRAQQSKIASGIADKKEALVNAIMNHSKSAIINGDDMKNILQGIMATGKRG